MYVKSMILEGFKSYGKRIEINGFDKEFNAITGFNGSGKSNILDAICFVLGITNLGHVRATSLQDLVYKSGQAGVKKASVTITFDNRNRTSSPIGYEHYEEITVTRQVVIDGKNKYMINGSNVPNKRVQDMFCSVQLNVNNPHFLIMQGRITKVLNMKPLEILSMIEEAAGTKMYENKKAAALVCIQKKDSKLNEINNILNEEIGPRLARLKEERTQFIEFQSIERELEHCRRIVIAWKYLTAVDNSEKAEGDVQNVKRQIDEKQSSIDDGKKEFAAIQLQIEETAKKQEAEKGDKLEALERELNEAEKCENKLTAEINSNLLNIQSENKNVEQLKANIIDDENILSTKEKELAKVGGLFKKLKDQDDNDKAAVAEAQERYQKVSAGLLQSDSGENATLEQQVINAKHVAVQAQTEMKQCEMGLKHIKEQLIVKEKELRATESEYRQDSKNLESKEKELKTLENELKKFNYNEGSYESLQNDKRELTREIRNLQERIDQFESVHPQLRFQYRDPEPGFRRDSVKGLVCKLLTLKDKSAAYALDIAAGGRLYNVIVDTETTSKALLQRGELQRRVTIIPLNKIEGRVMDQRTIDLAQKLVGKENVEPAMSLINYPENTKRAMAWIFGQIFVVKDMESARKIAFHDKIMKKCVTRDGDVVDPAGTLSGGALSNAGSVLLKIEELKALQKELTDKENKLREIDEKLAKISSTAEKYATTKQKFDLRSHDINIVKQRLQQTSHHKLKEEVESLQSKTQELTEKIEAARTIEKENTKRHKELESQLKDASTIREKQLKEAENQLKILQKKAELSRQEWTKREGESETLNLEITELRKTIDAGKEQLAKAEEKLALLEERKETLGTNLREAKDKVTKIQANVKTHKDMINKQNKEIRKLTDRKEEILSSAMDYELQIKKLTHEINSITNSAKECKQKVLELVKKHEWIEQDKVYFGKAGGIYDFEANDPEEITRKMHQLESTRERLSRNINTRAMNLLNKEEEQYAEMTKKRKIVENDRIKILTTIEALDAKKKETLEQAWEQVNKDFGSIFGTLLSGANAKLQPPENKTVLEGLEVKVGFGGVYKESLGELSGGQRSLVALSLVLAMLLFKPAPLYILDEVDAALDLSHTENIGTMLKRHFKHSQFIVVSLKDGMFNNANVLFKTKFVDGMSTISRTEKRNK